MDDQAMIQHSRLKHLENSMVVYGVYNAETLENLINTVHNLHNSTTEIERLFAGELNAANTWYISIPNAQEYAIDKLPYLRTVRDKYIQMDNKFITQLPYTHKSN